MTPAKQAQPRILVVDDEAIVRDFFACALETGGYQVTAAATAEDALAVVHAGPAPDAVFLDLRMPGMGGLGFLMCLRADDRHRRLPVAVVTGDATVPESMWTSIESLDVEICFKPLDMEAVLSLARRLTRKRGGRTRTPAPVEH